ncbi:MAG: hypothetical protein LBQ00_02850 [Syntrophobacterales bacterium]|jgi:Na+/phosphate symporter|nr:hypothetical protein [Syntrophobacterales bacterium]
MRTETIFGNKALKELNELFAFIEVQWTDIKDYILNGNLHMKTVVRQDQEDILRMAGEYTVIRQDRLIVGVFMSKASYLYIDMTDSLKRLAKGLVSFSGKV